MEQGDFVGQPQLPPHRKESDSTTVCGAEYVLGAPISQGDILLRLTVTPPPNPMHRDDGSCEPVAFGRMDGDRLVVPRFFGIAEFGPPQVDATTNGYAMRPACEFRGVLSTRTRQADVCAAVRSGWDSDDIRRHGARVTLPCGFGKTVVAIECIAHASRRALIIVPNTILTTQWRERLGAFLPDASVDELRGGMGAQRDTEWVIPGHTVPAATAILQERQRTLRVGSAEAAAGRKVTVRSQLLHVAATGASATLEQTGERSFTVRGDGSAPVVVRLHERLAKPPGVVESINGVTVVRFGKPTKGCAIPPALKAVPARMVIAGHARAPDVVVTTVQTMAMVDLPDEVLKTFGTVVVDEVHSLCARVFSAAMRRVPARRMLALSATPERRDGMHAALPWLCGVEVARLSRTWERVTVCRLTYTNPAAKAITAPDGRIMLARMITQLCSDDARTRCIAQRVWQLHKDGRCVLVLTERVEHMTQLQGAITRCTGEPTGALCGATPQDERASAAAHRIMVATYPMCRQGFDKAQLDTLVMATPVTSIEQCVGRILRPHPDKKTPTVIDVVDPYSIFMGEYRKRARQYRDWGYEVCDDK